MKAILIAAGLLMAATSVMAAPKPVSAPAPVSSPAPVPRTQVEIYRIAPGQHQAFLEFIAKCDKANEMAGLPPRQLYVHSDGADWDFMLIQPANVPEDKAAALDKAWDELGLPSGSNFFFEIRKYITQHTDTVTKGPTTAAAYLATAAK
ncbi:DUF4148 domain-containing protein [Asticcacaulis sp. 201]|uniref:DUF4148 domain-containing protein n=1 Tax=Asticcacaulis sp. 201 TaxID=3028787 RepID=UPI0029170F8D|nr:DUF4148 domain-containing protein [Asticcacaulis sp. 201]MDV6330739.1 DUF4148 domain-containing protein [Asticcacaulis sp. 201]